MSSRSSTLPSCLQSQEYIILIQDTRVPLPHSDAVALVKIHAANGQSLTEKQRLSDWLKILPYPAYKVHAFALSAGQSESAT